MSVSAEDGLMFMPYINSAHASSYTPVSIARAFPRVGHEIVAYLPSLRVVPPADLNYRTWLPPFLPRLIRGGRFHRWAYTAIAARLVREVRWRNGAVIWLWPGTDLETMRALKDAGAMLIREMINNDQASARAILEEEARRTGLDPLLTITDESIEAERRELMLADRLVSSNACVDENLVAVGFPGHKLYKTFYGWDPARFARLDPSPHRSSPFTALFVGEVTMRKGAHLALEAWRAAGIGGELRFVGRISPEMAEPLSAAMGNGRVRHVPYTSDIAAHYREADAFLFPTLEEGGPMVTIEAGAFGLPVVTGPMGTARTVEDGVSGLVVEPRDIDALAAALRNLAHDRDLRCAMAAAARRIAANRHWEHSARDRLALLRADLAAAA